MQLTQQLYARGEVTFLSLLQAQRILTETELAFVESQAERWNGAVAVADLLQLEVFPPTIDAPAAAPADFRQELGDDGRRVGRDPNQPPIPLAQPPAAGAPELIQPLPKP